MSKSITFHEIISNQIPIPSLIFTSYKSLGLNEVEMMVILQIHRFVLEGKLFPTPNDLASCLTINEMECSNILRKLIQRNMLSIDQVENEHQQLCEVFSLEPLWQKVFNKHKEVNEQNDGTLFILFEQEFGRPLSPFEIEMINAWLDQDQITPALIKAGLRESVLMGKLNFRYIDRILRDWKKKGIHTVEQAREATKQFRNQKAYTEQTYAKTDKKKDDALYFNWLSGED